MSDSVASTAVWCEALQLHVRLKNPHHTHRIATAQRHTASPADQFSVVLHVVGGIDGQDEGHTDGVPVHTAVPSRHSKVREDHVATGVAPDPALLVDDVGWRVAKCVICPDSATAGCNRQEATTCRGRRHTCLSETLAPLLLLSKFASYSSCFLMPALELAHNKVFFECGSCQVWEHRCHEIRCPERTGAPAWHHHGISESAWTIVSGCDSS